jgi:o-succinylbenzoate synthase
MRVMRIAWDRYRIPFVADFHTAHGALPMREGIVLRLSDDEGRSGLGEIAPLPPFGGQLNDALTLLETLAPTLPGSPIAMLIEQAAAHPAMTAFPLATRQVVLGGLELAACDLLAQATGMPLAHWLSGAESQPAVIPVNATLGARDIADAERLARQAIVEGFGCIKLKVGSSDSPDEEAARVAAVRRAVGPAIELRLDANGAWTSQQALAMLGVVRPYNIALVEQPTSPDDLAGLRLVRDHARGISIAADESASDAAAIEHIIATAAADVLILKPMLSGGPRPALALARRARAAGLGVIVTSLLDTGIGVCGALHIAAALPPPLPACGLATTALLADDLIQEALIPQHGRLAVPQRPGLGITLDEEALRRYRLQGSTYD